MYPAIRLGDMVADTCKNSPGPFFRGSTSSFVDGRPAIRLGDPAPPGAAISGSSTVFVDGRPAVRFIDKVFCGIITTGSTSTFYG